MDMRSKFCYDQHNDNNAKLKPSGNVMLVNFLIYFLFFNINQCQNWRGVPNVKIQQGVLEGMRIFTDSGRQVNAFLGIPYAAPPIGDLRFAPAQRHPGWNGTLQAVNYAPKCPQLPFNSNTNEDCLFLNIWVPEVLGNRGPLPVVLFFEGKNFYTSSNVPISGQDFAAEGLVVVNVNYRLNVFGFFCLGSAEARGNLGLLDQYFALLWVRDNIKQFGGDPDKITLYGHLSGAVSVMLHMMSPRTAGLFQRAIISSGSAVTPWQLQNDPILASKQILRLLGCDSYITKPLVCLRSKETEHILEVLNEYSESSKWSDKFLPVVDTFLPEHNRYLPLDPVKALKDGTYLQVPILTGIAKSVADEQYVEWLELASQGYPQLQQYIEKAKIPEIIKTYRFYSTNKDQLVELINWKYFYSYTGGDVHVLFNNLKQMEYDSKILAPHFSQLSHLIGSYVQPIYVYNLEDVGLVLNSTESTLTTDILLLFGPVLLKQIGRRRFSQNEINLSKQLKQFWNNFIIFGNPTPNTNQGQLWSKYTMGNFYIESFGTAVDNNQALMNRNQVVMFWNQLLPKLANIRNFSNNILKELQNSPDPAAGFRHAMYTLVALVIALLSLLLICVFLLKKRAKEREQFHSMVY